MLLERQDKDERVGIRFYISKRNGEMDAAPAEPRRESRTDDCGSSLLFFKARIFLHFGPGSSFHKLLAQSQLRFGARNFSTSNSM
jgi:hypothetical protein